MASTFSVQQTAFALLLLVCAGCLLPGSVAQRAKAVTFLGMRDSPAEKFGHADLLASLEELENITDFDHGVMIAARTERLDAALAPLFKIASQDAAGLVDATEARYLLHRLFAQRHGWFVNGIELHEGLMNTSRVGEAFFSGGGFSRRQLARFAATLETLVHAENVERLQKAFKIYRYKKDSAFSTLNAKRVIHAYMIYFISVAQPQLTWGQRKRYVEEAISDWADTKVFADEVMQKRLDSDETPTSLWNFSLQVVDEIGERYGRWQNLGCLKLKSQLMEMETPGTGRVPLTTFWKPVLDDVKNYPFVESVPFLEQMGAYDESAQAVVIPNYIYAASNCLAGSKYYDVCCINECEAILGEIEDEVGSPSAPPERLAEIISNQPSSTVEAPRALAPALRQRLDDIALQHRGVVPLHGRLFFQFLHHTYPRECPYPRHSLTKTFESNDFIKRMDEAARVTKDVIWDHIDREQSAHLANAGSAMPAAELPWSDDEELFMRGLLLDRQRSEAGALADNVGLLIPVLGLAVAAALFAFPCRKQFLRSLGISGKRTDVGGFFV
eukprot:TRINITY_DN332_c1_g3_i1.p1 TRINITY_DN332_c1_g3~~TRINITY_DN332_c1_g3_i1.p1  ORF type:complete len:584 (+),score=139.06 TRINITY_DN332_c1_g3_i1:83-1753(+)